MNLTRRDLILASLPTVACACTVIVEDSQPAEEVSAPEQLGGGLRGRGKDFFRVELDKGSWTYEVSHGGNDRNFPFQVIVSSTDTGEVILSSSYFTDEASGRARVIFTVQSVGEYAVRVNAQPNVRWRVEVYKGERPREVA